MSSIDGVDDPHTEIAQWDNGKLDSFRIDWEAHSACVCQHPSEQLIAVGETGRILVVGQGEISEELLPRPEEYFEDNPIREVRAINGVAYVTGLGRDVYRRDDVNRWTQLGPGLDVREDIAGFESIHGYSHVELYAAGWAGELWRYNGTFWSEINSPTNVVLTRVLCTGDGQVYACGQAGVLLRGRSDRWKTTAQSTTTADLWDLEYFRQKLFVTTMQFLYTLSEDEYLELVDFGGEIPTTCHHLSAADGVMWSIGEKDIVVFDGSTWYPLIP